MSRPIEHGTYGGYQQCRKRLEGSCPECRAANNAYLQQWRSANADRQHRLACDQRARDRALRRLARMFDAEFGVLYEEELAKERAQGGQATA